MQVGDWLEIDQWAEQEWGQAELGDKRRTRRIVKLTQDLAKRPEAHLPEACIDWAALKAAYRILSNSAVKPENLNATVWQNTLEKAKATDDVVLFIQDGSELNFTHHPHTTGLGFGGNPKQRSLMMQTTLCVQPQGHQSRLKLIGIANQKVWIRTESRKGETRKERDSRWNESDVWQEALESCQTPPKNTTWVSVSDRGSDDFTYFRKAHISDWKFAARAARTRNILFLGKKASLFPHIRPQLPSGQVLLHLRGREGRKKQDISLNISFSPVTLLSPKHGPDNKSEPLDVWVVRAYSDDGKLEWIILTNVPVNSFEDAAKIINWYAHRWVVEEFHKALKTGCRFEDRQLKTAEGLKNLLALLAPIAARLISLRSISRTRGDDLASEVYPLEIITLVIRKTKLKKPPEKLTLREFWHSVARIGGFIGRKNDGEPGWQTLWGGWSWLLEAAWLLEIPLENEVF